MKRIDYDPNSLSHHNENIQYWVTQGIVIDGERYSVEELFVRGNTLYGVISTNKIDFYEYPLATNVTQDKFDPSGILNRLDRLESIPQYKYDDTGINQRLDSLENDVSDSKSKLNQRVTLLENKPDNDNQELSISGNNLSISGGNTVEIPQPDLKVLNDFATKEYVDNLVKSSKYNPEPILDRLQILESKPDKDTIYDDTALKQRVKDLEDRKSTSVSSSTSGVIVSKSSTDTNVDYDVNIDKALDNYYDKTKTYTKSEVEGLIKSNTEKATDITVYKGTFTNKSKVMEGDFEGPNSPRITLTYSSSTGVGILKLDMKVMSNVAKSEIVAKLPSDSPTPVALIESQVWIGNSFTTVWVDPKNTVIRMSSTTDPSLFNKRIIINIPGIFKKIN